MDAPPTPSPARTRGGVQREILASLALVMLLSSLMLAALFVARSETGLRAVLGAALVQEARAPRADGLVPGTDWWLRAPDGAVRPLGGVREPIDAETLALAERVAQEGGALVKPGAPWSQIRFAARGVTGDDVRVARLPREASIRLRAAPLGVLLLALLANLAAFTGFGAFLLRRRVVGPLQALAGAARSRAEGVEGVRAPVQGVAEVADVAHAFNGMTEVLETQREGLTKAVVELRDSNRALRETRDGLERAERLAAVGSLAAGVAHEVGNPMGAILAFLDLARRDPGVSEATRQHLARAAREGERVRVILRQLLDFSCPSRGSPVPLDLEAAARETTALLSAQRRYREVSFEVSSSEPGRVVLADATAVSQILMNLGINAADAAVAGEAPRRVAFRVRAAVLSRRAGDADGPPPPRRAPDALECVVVDSGPGIPESERERIFAPFHTTKPPGQGTGLGLSNASRLAEEQGGRVEIVEAPAPYATAFALRLPLPRAPAGVRAAGPDHPEGRGAPQSASGSANDCTAAATGGRPGGDRGA